MPDAIKAIALVGALSVVFCTHSTDATAYSNQQMKSVSHTTKADDQSRANAICLGASTDGHDHNGWAVVDARTCGQIDTTGT